MGGYVFFVEKGSIIMHFAINYGISVIPRHEYEWVHMRAHESYNTTDQTTNSWLCRRVPPVGAPNASFSMPSMNKLQSGLPPGDFPLPCYNVPVLWATLTQPWPKNSVFIIVLLWKLLVIFLVTFVIFIVTRSLGFKHTRANAARSLQYQYTSRCSKSASRGWSAFWTSGRASGLRSAQLVHLWGRSQHPWGLAGPSWNVDV